MEYGTIRVVIDSGVESKKTTIKKPQEKKTPTKINQMDMMKSNEILKWAGKGLATATLANGIVGDISENRLRERRWNERLVGAGFLLTLASGNPVAIAGAGIYAGIKLAKHRIQVDKDKVTSSYLQKLSGDTINSGSRWRNVR